MILDRFFDRAPTGRATEITRVSVDDQGLMHIADISDMEFYDLERRERIARALYEHWVEEDFSNEYAGWELLGDKETWYARAAAVIAADPIGE